jgi:hypothetical protein
VAASSCLANKQLARIHQIHRLKRSSGAWICLPLNPSSTWPGSLAQSAAGRMKVLGNKYVTKGVAKTMSCFEIKLLYNKTCSKINLTSLGGFKDQIKLLGRNQ